MLAQHSSATVEHYTPPEFIEATREVMGGINLDPASCPEANVTVKADSFFAKKDDGLTKDWFGNVFLNPPGGLIGRKSSAAVWWGKLVGEHTSGRAKQAVFLGFTLEILATSQDCHWSLLDFPICVPRRRIAFLSDKDGAIVPGKSPAHSNVIAYLGPRESKFYAVFSKFGACR